jgi:Uma2 family endonuclease
MPESIETTEPVVLRGISWDTYQCLLKNYENQSAPRLTYDKGVLEIMSPLIPHEEKNRLIARIVETVLEEWDWEYRNVGSVTCTREDVARGFEPDSAFYIQNVAVVRDRDRVELERGDPAPDLIIEIDATSSSIPRQPLFAAFGVPEVWRFTDGQLQILTLSRGCRSTP